MEWNKQIIYLLVPKTYQQICKKFDVTFMFLKHKKIQTPPPSVNPKRKIFRKKNFPERKIRTKGDIEPVSCGILSEKQILYLSRKCFMQNIY
jgi:hypothetical protein